MTLGAASVSSGLWREQRGQRSALPNGRILPSLASRVEAGREWSPCPYAQAPLTACHNSFKSFITSAVAGLWSGWYLAASLRYTFEARSSPAALERSTCGALARASASSASNLAIRWCKKTLSFLRRGRGPLAGRGSRAETQCHGLAPRGTPFVFRGVASTPRRGAADL